MEAGLVTAINSRTTTAKSATKDDAQGASKSLLEAVERVTAGASRLVTSANAELASLGGEAVAASSTAKALGQRLDTTNSSFLGSIAHLNTLVNTAKGKLNTLGDSLAVSAEKTPVGAHYTRYGRRDCPSGSEMIYKHVYVTF